MTAAALVILGLTILATSFIAGVFGMAGGMILLGVLLIYFDVATGTVAFGLMWLIAFIPDKATVYLVLGGMPFVLSLAHGPGRVAFSRDAPGELVVLPLHPGMEVDAREHAFLAASHTVTYDFVRIKGLANLLHGGNGMYLDRFVTQG